MVAHLFWRERPSSVGLQEMRADEHRPVVRGHFFGEPGRQDELDQGERRPAVNPWSAAQPPGPGPAIFRVFLPANWHFLLRGPRFARGADLNRASHARSLEPLAPTELRSVTKSSGGTSATGRLRSLTSSPSMLSLQPTVNLRLTNRQVLTAGFRLDAEERDDD